MDNTSLFTEPTVESRRILYTPSSFAKSNLIYLQETGTLKAIKPHESRRENLSSYLCFMVTDGFGSLEYEGREYKLAAGDCAFIDCRKAYSHKCADSLWTLKWAHFYGSNMSGIYDKYKERGGRCAFTPENPYSFRALFDELYDVAASSSYIRDMQIYEKLTTLLTLLMQESWNPVKRVTGASKKQNLQKIKDYLDNNYAKKISLNDLAEKFFINKYYLIRIFKEQFGTTVTGYLMQVRITHAKQLLRFSDMPIEKIAADCGMADANYFSRMFKKVEGITPGEYRKKW